MCVCVCVCSMLSWWTSHICWPQPRNKTPQDLCLGRLRLQFWAFGRLNHTLVLGMKLAISMVAHKYIYIYTCLSIYMYVYVVYLYVYVYICVYIYIHNYIYIYMEIYIYIYGYTYIYIYAKKMCVCVYIYICILGWAKGHQAFDPKPCEQRQKPGRELVHCVFSVNSYSGLVARSLFKRLVEPQSSHYTNINNW